MAAAADAALPHAAAFVPCCLLEEVLADGTCPLHVRLQLSRAVDKAPSSAGGLQEEAAESRLRIHSGGVSAVASFLTQEELLFFRAASRPCLLDAMQRERRELSLEKPPPPQVGSDAALQQLQTSLLAQSSAALAGNAPQLQEEGSATAEGAAPGATAARTAAPVADARSAAMKVHERIRLRLWLQRLARLATYSPDEHIFETSIRNYVDEALRRRLEGEVLSARMRMEDEVREAKATMLRCVQAVSDEVDRRVRDKVATLQAELDRRTAEQSRELRELVEKRVGEQTTALQEEVDRRTDHLRSAMEQRAQAQEFMAAQLRIEVLETRALLEQRVMEQETATGNLLLELKDLRGHLVDVTQVREQLDLRVKDLEAFGAKLRAELTDADALAAQLRQDLAAARQVQASRSCPRRRGGCLTPMARVLQSWSTAARSRWPFHQRLQVPDWAPLDVMP
eukprot:TRINITY_DN33352_c0_g1_i1.p1 TRINITY_DN33352_c0_g1~~TRINITY_DN33352_c0_g1_i1.p1  ORF type:complete len:454 (-),score=151.68 TRINITY_DN33352_c0_g1_i1:163-1524(-)